MTIVSYTICVLQVRVHDAYLICTIACDGISTMMIMPDAYLHVTGQHMVMVGQMHELHVTVVAQKRH